MRLMSFLVLSASLLFSCAASTQKNSSLSKEVKESKKVLYEYVSKKEFGKNVSADASVEVKEGRPEKVTKSITVKSIDLLEKDLQKVNKREVERRIVEDPPVPITVPPKVVRILILPYIDRKGNLHSDSYVFVEIKKARWLIGEYGKGSLTGGKYIDLMRH